MYRVHIMYMNAHIVVEEVHYYSTEFTLQWRNNYFKHAIHAITLLQSLKKKLNVCAASRVCFTKWTTVNVHIFSNLSLISGDTTSQAVEAGKST